MDKIEIILGIVGIISGFITAIFGADIREILRKLLRRRPVVPSGAGGMDPVPSPRETPLYLIEVPCPDDDNIRLYVSEQNKIYILSFPWKEADTEVLLYIFVSIITVIFLISISYFYSEGNLIYAKVLVIIWLTISIMSISIFEDEMAAGCFPLIALVATNWFFFEPIYSFIKYLYLDMLLIFILLGAASFGLIVILNCNFGKLEVHLSEIGLVFKRKGIGIGRDRYYRLNNVDSFGFEMSRKRFTTKKTRSYLHFIYGNSKIDFSFVLGHRTEMKRSAAEWVKKKMNGAFYELQK
jgi:hypothetical protein